jgi:two-component system, sensor histidine kinase and response regulator
MNSTNPDGVILLVDDNPMNLEILVHALGASGYRICVAQDGASAIAQLPYAQPDLILLDVMMPHLDGFETCRRIKADPINQGIPIIFMTALTDTIDKVQGFQVGAVDYITKPFEIEEVLARVRTHLTVQGLQNQLQAQNQQLQAEIVERQKAQEAVQLLLRAVSHDLRNPVTGERMVLMSLLQEVTTEDTCISVPTAIVQRMIQSCDRQLDLINSLLESHTNDIHGAKLALQPVHLPNLVHNLIANWQPLLTKNEATLENQIPDPLPLVQADPNQLWRVYDNLIANSLKHNPPGLHLTLDAEIVEVEIADIPNPPSQWLRCTVQDNGRGMAAEQCETMFELYKRGSEARRTIGLGLGLYLCKQIITAHAGQIGVSSHPGNGSTFWFTLPLYQKPH